MHERIGERPGSPGRAATRAPADSALSNSDGRLRPSVAAAPVCRNPRRLTDGVWLTDSVGPVKPALGCIFEAGKVAVISCIRSSVVRENGGRGGCAGGSARTHQPMLIGYHRRARARRLRSRPRPVKPSVMLNRERVADVARRKETNGEKAIRQRIDGCRITPGQKVRLSHFDTEWGGGDLRDRWTKRELESLLTQDVGRLARAQDLLYADASRALLIVFQAMDAAGKDSTIKHVMSGVNPTGCQVYSFKPPSGEELKHTFLWRCTQALPERGRIGIFNRSHYEDVLVVKVHPELLQSQHIPKGKPQKDFWGARYDDINNFERHLDRNGTRIVKFFLHVSKAEQGKRD